MQSGRFSEHGPFRPDFEQNHGGQRNGFLCWCCDRRFRFRRCGRTVGVCFATGLFFHFRVAQTHIAFLTCRWTIGRWTVFKDGIFATIIAYNRSRVIGTTSQPSLTTALQANGGQTITFTRLVDDTSTYPDMGSAVQASLSGLNLSATDAITYLGAAVSYNFGTSQYYPFIARNSFNASMRYGHQTFVFNGPS